MQSLSCKPPTFKSRSEEKAELLHSARLEEAAEVQEAEDQAGHLPLGSLKSLSSVSVTAYFSGVYV